MGFISDTSGAAYIYPSMLNQALTRAGFTSPRKVIRYMAEQGLIGTETDRRTGKKAYSVVKRFESRTSRFVEFFVEKLTESPGRVCGQEEQEFDGPGAQRWEQQNFEDLDGSDEELPF